MRLIYVPTSSQVCYSTGIQVNFYLVGPEVDSLLDIFYIFVCLTF